MVEYTVTDEQQERLGHLTLREWTSIAHLRGWCHNSVACPTCLSERKAMAFWTNKGRADAIREIAEG
jgi:hypothetical protein